MKKSLHMLFAVLAILVLAISACAPATPAPTEEPVVVEPTAVPPTKVPEPTATAVPELGTADNPLIMALAPSATTQELQTGGQAIADKLSELTGYTITVTVPTNYAAMIEAMGAGNAHIGWLAPVQYIVAHGKGYADVGLATVRNGSNHYGLQYVANAAAGFTSYYDAATGKNTADAATALAQFADKKPCWTDPLSASGYILPSGLLKANDIKTKAGAWVQGHPTVIKSVYLSPKGEICDFGATYIDAREYPVLADEYPHIMDEVIVVWQIPAVIPYDGLFLSSSLPADLQTQLRAALAQVGLSGEGQRLMASLYNVENMIPVEDVFYAEFVRYITASGADWDSLVR